MFPTPPVPTDVVASLVSSAFTAADVHRHPRAGVVVMVHALVLPPLDGLVERLVGGGGTAYQLGAYRTLDTVEEERIAGHAQTVERQRSGAIAHGFGAVHLAGAGPVRYRAEWRVIAKASGAPVRDGV